MTEELKRRINNIVQVGAVTEIKSIEGLALARVNVLGRVTDFLPVFMWANDFVKVWMPIRVNQQVAVLSPFGNGNGGLILPSIYNKGCKEPSGANDGNVIIEFAKGVRIESDGENINIDVPKDINVICTNANVKASSVKVDSPSIDLGLGGKGVVTGECICAFTGKPHHDFSSNTRSAK
jgi:phage baseplate assembly protein V